MPDWICPSHKTVDNAKKMVSTVLTANFLQLLVFSMDNAFNNDNFEKLFLVSVESV